MKCKIPRPPGIPRLAPSSRAGRGKAVPMSAPPVEAGRRAPPPPSAPTSSDGAPGRLACSLQSLRGRLSRGRAPEAPSSSVTAGTVTVGATAAAGTVTAASTAAGASVTAAAAAPAAAPAGHSEGSDSHAVGAAAQNGERRARGQSPRGQSRGEARGEGRGEGRSELASDAASAASAASETGDSEHTRVSARAHASASASAEGDKNSEGDASGKRDDSAAPVAADAQADAGTSAASAPHPKRPTSASPSRASRTDGDSNSSPSPEEGAASSSAAAGEKPHICGSFFSPCCSARRAGGGVKTFSSASAGSAPSAAGSSAGRQRSPVSLARILSRPVFGSTSSTTSSPPPQHHQTQHQPQPPARKKSSIVYFHPEFQPGVIGDDDPTDTGSPRAQMPSRSMGNSSSAGSGSPQPRSPTFRPRVTLPPDYEYMKKLVPELKLEIKQKDARIAQLEVELSEARRIVSRKDNEVSKLHREIHKIQSVLAQAGPPISNGDLVGKLHGNHLNVHSKKQGVSGESSHLDGRNMTITAPKFEKDFRSKQLIKEAIMDNDFLKKLDSSQLREIVDSMYPKKYANGTFIIREGEVGSHLFVAAEGQMEVIKEGQVLGQMGPGKAFGELAILYNCTRTASVKAVTDVHVWELERRVFQTVMMRTAIRRLEDNLSFLRSVPLLAKLSRDKLVKMADVIETETYAPGAYIIRQGTSGDGFYIISSGSVKVTQRSQDGVEDEIRTLKTGEYFGEQALLKEDKRTANIIALPPSVTVLALDRTSFARLIGDLQELRDLKYEERPVSRTSSAQSTRLPNEYSHLTLDSLDIIATLGIGGFGRVELVQSATEPGKTLALKCLKKHYIVETQQQEHVHSEKEIMMRCNHQFIVRLYKTFKDSKYVYLLMDACLGGEVWSILRDRGQFDTEACRFYTACVVEALEYLHTRHIVYRDLKPENLLLDTEGFCKLTDFGFSKELRSHGKTWTFCGTPEYVSPEVILNKGHDRAVDYWSLGVLMYELYTGAPPFSASDPMKTYNIILKGIDIIDFPRNIPRSGEQLIKKLCRDVPTERLGCQRNGVEDIRKHRWFQGFDWEGLRGRQLTPPILPQVKGPTDASNFDCYSRDLETPPDELSGWDEDF